VTRPFAFLAALIFPFAVAAQSYPAKPLRLICPFPPAGAVDIASRATAHELTKILGQTVTVENKPGAGGNLGGAEAARSAPDGYTLFMSTSGIQAINPALYAKMPFDPNKDLVPVAPLVSLNNVLVLHPSVPAKSVKEVIALAKSQPGKLNFASSGNGTSIHMSGAMFLNLTGVDMIHIPYKGSGPAVTDLLGGQVMMMFDNIPSSLPHIKAGKLRALAHWGERPLASLPEVPSLQSLGVKAQFAQWSGLFVPAATPDAIVQRLRTAARNAANDPAVRQTIARAGSPVEYLDAPEFQAYWDADAALMADAVKGIGKVE
jgi:tripartite-type tricarboxylate transporter receptor subunit TctC